MEIETSTVKKVLLLLFKDFSKKYTITSLANEIGISRVGIWKVLKKLELKKYIILSAVGLGKTNPYIINIDLDNIIIEKIICLYLTEEAVKQKRWQVNFFELEREVNFTILFGSILHSPQQANDIDIVNIVNKNRFVKIQNIIDKIQKTQEKKIHAINFTEEEFMQELKKSNKVYIGAIKRGVILFNQEKFVKFMKGIVK